MPKDAIPGRDPFASGHQTAPGENAVHGRGKVPSWTGRVATAERALETMASTRQADLIVTVNGRPHPVEASPDTPLLYVLRNELGLNSVRFGCGISRCGACTVHVDGEPVRSCVYPVSDAEGAEVTTLEGLGTPENLHPLQQAFLEEQAAQCGYCIPGMIMSAAALLEENSDPNEQAIHDALGGNLCRCGTHIPIMQAIQRAASTTS